MAESPMPEGGSPAPEGGDEASTGTLPLAMWGGRPVKEGDTFQVRVISVDQQGGSATVAMAGYDQAPKKPGSDGMAEEMDEQPKEEGAV